MTRVIPIKGGDADVSVEAKFILRLTPKGFQMIIYVMNVCNVKMEL